VKFKVDFRGYVRAEAGRSTGTPELDGEIESVIRLAEPYTAGSVDGVAVCFGTAFPDL
jgi:hypothetical protein